MAAAPIVVAEPDCLLIDANLAPNLVKAARLPVAPPSRGDKGVDDDDDGDDDDDVDEDGERGEVSG